MKTRIYILSFVVICMCFLYNCTGSDSKMKLQNLKLGFYKSSLEFIDCQLNEDFYPDSLDYSANVEKSYTDSVFVTAVLPEDSQSTVSISGMEAMAGEPFKINLHLGDNLVNITLKNKHGKSKTYKLTIKQEDLSEVYVSELVAPGLWRIDDFGGALGNENMYLFEGKDKALLFDTGMGKGDLAAYLKTLTELPVEVALTHGHYDHFGQVDQFEDHVVYMSGADSARLPANLNTSKFRWIREGDIIDIGSGRSFEVVEVPGHTMGCVIYLDSKNKLAVVGDGLSAGSMVWMHLPGCAPLDQYLENLIKVEGKLKNLDGVTLLVGHQYQEKTPLTGSTGKQLITDLRIVTEKVLNEEIIGEPAFTIRNGVKTGLRQAYYGLAGLWYNPDNLKTKSD